MAPHVAAVASAVLSLSLGAGAVQLDANRGFLSVASGMQPQVVAQTLAQVEDKWTAQAMAFAACNATSTEGADCSDSHKAFEQSCSAIVSAVVKASSGDRAAVSEYMGVVCGEPALKGVRAEQCQSLAGELAGAMTADNYDNRENFDAASLCSGFWTRFAASEQAHAAAKEAEEKRAEEEAQQAAEAKEKAEEEAAEQAQHDKELTEQLAAQAAEEAAAATQNATAQAAQNASAQAQIATNSTQVDAELATSDAAPAAATDLVLANGTNATAAEGAAADAALATATGDAAVEGAATAATAAENATEAAADIAARPAAPNTTEASDAAAPATEVAVEVANATAAAK